jgi:hypothetical protein
MIPRARGATPMRSRCNTAVLVNGAHGRFGSGMVQREPGGRIEASLPMDGQECARKRHRKLVGIHLKLSS